MKNTRSARIMTIVLCSLSAIHSLALLGGMASALCGSPPVTLILQSRFRRDQVAEGSEFVDLYQDPYAEARAALEATVAQLNGTTDQLELLEGEYNCVAVPMTPITIENADQFI